MQAAFRQAVDLEADTWAIRNFDSCRFTALILCQIYVQVVGARICNRYERVEALGIRCLQHLICASTVSCYIVMILEPEL